MFELIKLIIAKKGTTVKAFFDFVYDGFVVKNAWLCADENSQYWIEMPHKKRNNGKKDYICSFAGCEEIIEPLKALVISKYEREIKKLNLA